MPSIIALIIEPHNKMERLSSGPVRALLSQLPSRDKTQQDIKRRKIGKGINASGFHDTALEINVGASYAKSDKFMK